MLPNDFVDLVGELEVVGNLFGIFEGAGAHAIVANAVGRLVGHGDFVGFAGDFATQGLEAGAADVDLGDGLGAGEGACEFFRDEAVSCLVEMHAVFGERLGMLGEERFAHFEEVDEGDVFCFGDGLHRLFIKGEIGVAFFGVGKFSGVALLDGGGRGEDELGFGVTVADKVEVESEIFLKLRESFGAGEGLVHAEAHHDTVAGVLLFESRKGARRIGRGGCEIPLRLRYRRGSGIECVCRAGRPA